MDMAKTTGIQCVAFAAMMMAAWAEVAPATDRASVSAAAKQVKWEKHSEVATGVRTAVGNFKPDGANELRLSAVCIATKSPWLEFVGTGKSANWGKPMADAKSLYDPKGVKIGDGLIRVTRERTADFMARAGGDVVVAFPSSSLRPPWSGDFASPGGLVISGGEVVAENPVQRPLLVVWKDGTVAIRTEPLARQDYGNVQVAHTGYDLIRWNGEDIVAPTRNTRAARLVAGVSADGSHLWIVEADDGAKLGYGTGATYHDMNAVLSALGCDNGMCLAFSTECGVYVRDKSGAVSMLNKVPGGAEPGRVATSIGVRVAKEPRHAAAHPQAQKAAPTEKKSPEQVDGKFMRTRLAPIKKKSGQTLGGQLTASLSSDLQRFRRPVLYVAALYDVDGMWRMYDVICTAQDTCFGHLMAKDQTPQQLSKGQPEVSRKAWDSPKFGNVRAGFFSDCSISPNRAKLIGYRLELWQNGGLVDSYDSNSSAVRRAGAPEDWYVKGKYSGRIIYRWPPAK